MAKKKSKQKKWQKAPEGAVKASGKKARSVAAGKSPATKNSIATQINGKKAVQKTVEKQQTVHPGPSNTTRTPIRAVVKTFSDRSNNPTVRGSGNGVVIHDALVVQRSSNEADAQSGTHSQAEMQETVFKLRATISILFMLTQRPLPPDNFHIQPAYQHVNPRLHHWLLPFDVEDQLLRCFSFLSAFTRDPKKVAALCFEHANPSSSAASQLCLKVAANHGDLEPLRAGLQSIVHALKLPSNSPGSPFDHQIEDAPSKDKMTALLRSITSLNCNRILCLLCSRHARWDCNFAKRRRTRTSVLTRLQAFLRQGIGSIKEGLIGGRDMAHLEMHLTKLEATRLEAFNKVTKSVVDRVINILQLIYNLWRDPNMRPRLEASPLRSPFSKIARYRGVASYLIRQSEQHPVITHIAVQTIRLIPLTLPERTCQEDNLLKATAALVPSEHVASCNARLISQIRSSKTLVAANEQFTQLVQVQCPVHAEMQLLFHYETRTRETRPRIILSTKKACFLCALFFRVHGRYHLPNTHGQLYDKWTLPKYDQDDVGMCKIVERFLGALQNHIVQSICSPIQLPIASTESLSIPSIIWARLSKHSLVQTVLENLTSRPGVSTTSSLNQSPENEPQTSSRESVPSSHSSRRNSVRSFLRMLPSSMSNMHSTANKTICLHTGAHYIIQSSNSPEDCQVFRAGAISLTISTTDFLQHDESPAHIIRLYRHLPQLSSPTIDARYGNVVHSPNPIKY